MEDKYGNLIDFRKILEAKAPKLMKRMPNWVFRRIQKLLHEEDINTILSKYGHLQGVDFVQAVVRDFNLNVVVQGAENLTASDRIIVASNHPLGGLDGIALIGTVGTYCPDPVTPVNDFLMFVKNLQPIFIPVNKAGKGVANRVVTISHLWGRELNGHISRCKCRTVKVLLVVNINDTHNLMTTVTGNLLNHLAHLAVAD